MVHVPLVAPWTASHPAETPVAHQPTPQREEEESVEGPGDGCVGGRGDSEGKEACDMRSKA